MLIECKKDKEKVAMGLLSYLPDFKNLINLKDEIKLSQKSSEFNLYLYSEVKANCIGVVGTQNSDQFVIVRYISMAPGYRNKETEKQVLRELVANFPKQRVTTVPEYSFLNKVIAQKNE